MAFKIFDSIVKPILLYASDFWGLHNINAIDKALSDQLHTRFCKWILGVSKRTSNMGVLIETGRYPLTIDGQLRCINNWIRIMGRGGGSDLLLITEDMAQKDDSYCLIALKKFLKENNL